MIILIATEKGGTGKTTLSTNLAVLCALNKQDVLIVDTDRQGSASAWCALRASTHTQPVINAVSVLETNAASIIRQLATKYQTVIVDAGAGITPLLTQSLAVADRLYIPIAPSQFDLWALTELSNMIDLAKGINPKLQSFIVFNHVTTNVKTSEVKSAQDMLERTKSANIELTDIVIHERISFRAAQCDGLSVCELMNNQDGLKDVKAANEVQQLYNHIYHATIQRKAKAG